MEKNPLVSVVVITYNSSVTVLETLESIKQQTYKNIELIISDDCSKDNTVDICRKWVESNQSFFVRTAILIAEQNTGTSANCNRGVRNTKGEWIKLIAGDDRLLPNCISDYVNYIQENPNANIIFSKVIPFGDKDRIKDWAWADDSLLFERFNKRQMKILLCVRNPFPAASAFMRKETILALGGYDESIPIVEDWPFLIRATNEAGLEISFMNKQTAEYRFSESAVSHGNINYKHLENIVMCEELGRYYLRKISPFSHFYFFTLSHVNDNFFMKLLHRINIINPFYHEYNSILRQYEEMQKDLFKKQQSIFRSDTN